MSEDFKRKLEQYEEGTLSEQEQLEMEAELEKMETYQTYLDEIMKDKEMVEGNRLDERKMIKKGKRKSLIVNVSNTIFAFIGLYLIGFIISGFYYNSGNPNRFDRYREAIEVSVAATMPNVSVRGGGMDVNRPFMMTIQSEFTRQVGSENYFIGGLEGRFFFSNFHLTSGIPRSMRMNPPRITYPINLEAPEDWFKCHEGSDCERELAEAILWHEWNLRGEAFNQLENLPEGTVAEVFISFDEFMTTEAVFRLFEDREMELRWLAVESSNAHEWNNASVGFPYEGFSLREDHIITNETRGGLFNSLTGWGSEWHGFEPFGDEKRREDEFLRALKLMQRYSNISREFTWMLSLNLDETITHIEETGVRIPGVVVTGPTRELLALQEEPWVRQVEAGEVALWNWNSGPILE